MTIALCLLPAACARLEVAPVRGHVLAAGTGEMEAVADFGDNPGNLSMFEYAPVDLPAGAPLVVALHGCTQGAQDMVAAGWNELADAWGFAVLYPEQKTDNNPLRCFNWAGEYGDTTNLERGGGENASVVAMVDHMIAEHALDASRVYVWGFSAGGGFASVLLATWPDVFAGGAILSGLPYACATTVQQAYDCQQLGSHPERGKTAEEWGDLVRAAAPAWAGPWPRVSLWHGASDTFMVHHANLTELVEQWTDVHGIAAVPTGEGDVLGHAYAHYDAGGATVVESTLVAGMGHAVAMGADDPEWPCAPAGGFAMYFDDRSICSTGRIARFFGLDGAPADPADPADPVGPGDPAGPGGAPTIAITYPSDGAAVSGAVTVTAQVVASEPVQAVEFQVDGRSAATDRIAPYWFEWGAGEEAPGPHRVLAIVTTASGASARDEVSVTVGAGGATPDDAGDAGAGAESLGCSAPSGRPAGGIGLALLGLLAALPCRRGRP